MEKIQTYLDWARKGETGIIRYVIGLFFVLSISLFFGQIFSVLGAILIPYKSAGATILKTTFFGFFFSFLAIPLVVRILHDRPWWSVAMPKLSFEKRIFLAGIMSVLIFRVIQNIIMSFIKPGMYQYSQVNLVEWLVMFVLAAIAFFVQASTEEMVYRGYLTQLVYRFTKNAVILFLIPSLIFSYPHYGNIEGVHGIVALAPYIIIAFTYFWLAYRSGSLWASVGAHAAGNWFITMFVGSAAEKIQKVSLFLVPASEMTAYNIIVGSLISALGTVVIFELIVWKFKFIKPLPISHYIKFVKRSLNYK